MADQIYYSVFTKKGLELLTEAIRNGTKLGITSMAFGDGGGSLPVPNESFTKLVNEVHRTQLNSLAPDPNNANWLRAEAIIASATGGFNIRELGLYAGDVLVAYSNYPATYKPNPSDGTARIMTFRMILQIDNVANFELVIDPDVVLATIQLVNNVKQELYENLYQKISTCEALQVYDPLFDKQITDVQSFEKDWDVKTYGLPYGGGKFIYMPHLDPEIYKSDGGTIIVTDDKKVWVREELFTSKQPKIYAEWFGCDNSFYTDDAVNIRKALAACLFWRNTGTIDSKYAIGGMLGSKVTLVMPKQWYIKSTVYINMTYITVDLNDGIGLVSNNGTYDSHPILTGYKMGLAFVGTAAKGIDFAPAYYSNRIMYNGTLIYGDIDSTGNIGRFPLNDSKIIAASYYGTTETIRSAVGTIDNVAYSCFGAGYSNGDFGWGYTHNDCKFDQCYQPFILTGAKDNGEKMTMINCMSFNCGYLGDIGSYAGDFEWQGGSWDYPNFGGFSLGTSDSSHAMIRLGRIEYNPAVVGNLIDGSKSRATCILSGALILFAAPTSSSVVTSDMLKSSYDHQFKLVDCKFIDHSASASITQNHKISSNFKVILDNIKSVTLFDYFLTKSCLNAQGVGAWSVTLASTLLSYTVDTAANTMTIKSSATSAQEQIMYLFIPFRDLKNFTDVCALLKASIPDVGLSVIFSIGFKNSAGNIISSYHVDGNVGGAFTVKNGITFPYQVYENFNAAKHYRVEAGKNYTEQGLMLKFNMYNLLASSGNVVIDGNSTGAVTL
ncbi:phage tail protein [Acinetobacter ursingii]|uniref:phage tail protein n=1 Tax=Acinetobacter ursingii TaxID=108980 RepID=UPI00124CF7B4|nr:phage tail protein [Acinetobacter ursingii]